MKTRDREKKRKHDGVYAISYCRTLNSVSSERSMHVDRGETRGHCSAYSMMVHKGRAVSDSHASFT